MCNRPLDSSVEICTSGVEDVLEWLSVADILLNVVEVGLEKVIKCLWWFDEGIYHLGKTTSEAIYAFDSLWICYRDCVWANPDKV